MKGSLSAALLLLTLMCAGCPHPLWLPDRNLKERVSEDAVVGSWQLTSNSLALLAREGFKHESGRTYSLEFLPTRHVHFHSVLDDFQGGKYCEADGVWALEHDTKGDSNIAKKNALRLELRLPDSTFLRYLNFDKDRAGLLLWNFYGDPDSWEFMEYRKAGPDAGEEPRDGPRRDR